MNTFYLKTVVIWFPKFVSIMVIIPFWVVSVFFIAHQLEMNYYVNFLGHLGSNGFQLI